jgi:hypothetical protein
MIWLKGNKLLEDYMQKILKVFLISTLVSFCSLSYSDNHIPTFGPMEAFGCNFSENRDMNDLMRVVKEWNKYSDTTGTNYSAWVLTPYYFNSSETHDIYWIGFSSDFEEMGRASEVMLTEEGSKINDKFNSVVPCDEHSLWGTEVIRAPKAPVGDGYLTISECTLSAGATREAVLAADEQWNAYLDSSDAVGGLYRWYPGSGVSSTEFTADFLLASTIDSLQSWGKVAERNVNGGGNMVAVGLYGELMTCTDQRVYSAKNVRLSTPN